MKALLNNRKLKKMENKKPSFESFGKELGDFNHVDAFLPEAEQRELNELRIAQVSSGPGGWTKEQRERFLELQKKENAERAKRYKE